MSKTKEITSTIGIISTILFGTMFEISLIINYISDLYYKILIVLFIISSLVIIRLLINTLLNSYNLSKNISKID
jgi:hypothetical protein